MKNQLIAALVGGILLFVWQFLSWSFLGVHNSEMSYTPKQDSILQALSGLEELTYFLPNTPPGTVSADQQAYMEKSLGKPWAILTYHKSMSNNMPMNMARGLAVDFVAVWLLVWLFGKMGGLDFGTALLGSLAVGAIGYMLNPYTMSIWFETSSIGHLIDTVVGWGLVGLWLGWYLGKK